MAGAARQPFMDELSGDEQRALLARSRRIRARKGQMIVGAGESSRDVFIVEEGRLQAVLYAANGREISLRDLEPGQLFGELAAIDGHERSASIVALTEARLLAIPDDAFRTTIRDSRRANEWMLRRLVAQVRSLTNRVFEMSALHVQARLHCELLRLARTRAVTRLVDPAPTHSELANRIGTHREAVTRELNVLVREGIIRSSRRKLEFVDVARLEDALRDTLSAPVAQESGW